MKRKISIVATTILIVLLAAYGYQHFWADRPYGPGQQDFAKCLTGGYMLYRFSANEVKVTPEYGRNETDAIIPEKILRINESHGFIIAERQGMIRRSPTDSLDDMMLPDTSVTDFWILNTHKNSVLRYLSRQQFKAALDSLKLPIDLPLIDVNAY